MKIQCDVCNKEEASFYCVADDASLCKGCDHKVHYANKVASKHHRFTLLHPPAAEHSPLCDICKERKAFLFCQQDRAILCRECDASIHKVNEHTKKHSRFLLTGVKLSATSDVYSSASDSAKTATARVGSVLNPKPRVSSKMAFSPGRIPKIAKTSALSNFQATPMAAPAETNHGLTSSSLSEYLEMLPGYHVEDLLDSSPPYGLYKMGGNGVMPFWENDIESSMCSISSEKDGVSVPQASSHQHKQTQTIPTAFGGSQFGFSRKWTDDNCFAVPEMRTSSTSLKRSRIFW
ncbi:unnamed protein product [Cuscuta epithymum]|uniref:B box-type domain-containing protein n=1 Tax=Cuscuta epithymum TaxID=186058 RepID=A0AAV0CA82_9ASTE|nr:unnamed protein product [Cuscuta epithymum]